MSPRTNLILKVLHHTLTTIGVLTGIALGYNQLRIWQDSGQSHMDELMRGSLIAVFAICILAGGVLHYLAVQKAKPSITPTASSATQTELERVRKQLADETSAKNDREGRLNQLQKQYDIDITALRAELKKSQAEHQKEVDALREEYAQLTVTAARQATPVRTKSVAEQSRFNGVQSQFLGLTLSQQIAVNKVFYSNGSITWTHLVALLERMEFSWKPEDVNPVDKILNNTHLFQHDLSTGILRIDPAIIVDLEEILKEFHPV